MLSYVLPTRNRPEHLAATLAALGAMPRTAHDPVGGAEVIVVDNASSPPPACPIVLPNAMRVDVVQLSRNEGAAGRNTGVEAARGGWIVMLDDDSHPLDSGLIDAILDASDDVAAIGADIFLAEGGREAGGLPEVFIGCGVVIRRSAFLNAGGYDPSLHYYAEEYDLAAKFLLAGHRVVHDRRFRVMHRKTTLGRDMNVILRRLVRNNAWIAQRYAPDSERRPRISETITRYAAIASKERALRGYAHGVMETMLGMHKQRRTPMGRALFDRFTGLAAARQRLADEPSLRGGVRVTLVDEGKNAWAVRQALRELGTTIVADPGDADSLVIATLSPGPMLDAWERRAALGQRVIRPWSPIEPASTSARTRDSVAPPQGSTAKRPVPALSLP